MKSVNMAGFGYSVFNEKVKIHTGSRGFSVGKSNSEKSQSSFGITMTGQAQKKDSDNGRLSAILIKFNAGKKLTAEELAYLRQKQPETYIKVQQIMMEREMLERRMKAAKTKEQTSAAYISSVGSVPMGKTGESSGGASMNIARMNQMSEAHRIYTATKEYQAKMDRSDLVEEEKLKQEEMSDKMEKQLAQLEESIEKQELFREEFAVQTVEEKKAVTVENKKEEAKDAMEEVERLKKASRRKRKKVIARRKTSSRGGSTTFHFNPLSEEKMYEKLRELYRSSTTSKKSSEIGSTASAANSAALGADSAPITSDVTINSGSTIDISL